MDTSSVQGESSSSSKNVSGNRKALQFGAMVYLCFENEKNQEYFSTAEGFTKNKIRLKQGNVMEKDGNYTSGLFRIFPPFYNSEYIKTKQLSQQKKSEKRDKHKPFNRRAARQEIPKQIKLMEEEASLNYDQYEKQKGTPVMFGQTIQLLHHNSNKYLQFDQKSVSDFESDNLKVSLNEEYSEETQFKILPCFSYQQESQGMIFDEDTVYIVSTIDSRNSVGDPYLHASKDIGEQTTSDAQTKKEMNVSTDKKSQWKIRVFCDYNDDKNGMLSVCDIVWINYSEKDLNLLVQKIAENEKSEKYLLRFEDCDSTEKYKKFVGNSNGMFVVESENMLYGGLVEWDKSYRLRHLTTNHYLSLVVMGTNEVIQDDRCLVLQADPSKASFFKFELIYSTLIQRNRKNLTKYMQKDSYFRMSVRAQQISQNGKGSKDDGVFWLKTADSDEFREAVREYQDVANVISNETQIFPAFSKIKKEENVFKLNKASANEVRMTEFLLSCRKTIKKTFPFLDPEYMNSADQGKFQSKYKKFLVMVGRLDRCLIDLNRFCHNKLRAYLNIDQEFGAINSFIQNVLREQLFIELLVSLLALSFPTVALLNETQVTDQQKNNKQNTESSENSKHKEIDRMQAFNQEIIEEFVQKKKKVATLIYKLLSSICQQNRKNQERTSCFLPLFAMQAKYIPSCMECIFQIIKDFSDLLQNQLQNDHFESNVGLDVKLEKKQSTIVRAFHTDSHEIAKILSRYGLNYEFVSRSLKTNPQGLQLKQRWDMFEFFCYQLIETSDFNTKKELLKFLGFASTDKGEGVNENQELIYKYLIPSENKKFMYEQGYFIPIQSQDQQLLVTHELRSLLDIVKRQNYQTNKKISSIEQNQVVKRTDEEVLSFFVDQMEFFVSMCNKRNNTWKTFVDKSCKFESLVETVMQDKITYDIRAIICSLLNKLYVDQEPKRLMYYPELCKVISTENIQDWNEEKEFGKSDISDDILIKEKLISYVKEKSKLIEDISEHIKISKSSNSSQEEQELYQKLQQRSNEVYNHLTYQIINLLRLMTDFGKYNIHNDISKFAKQKEKFDMQQAEFFEIIQNIMAIFEFDKTFPEARKTLLNKRQEDKLAAQRQFQEQTGKAIMSIFSFAKDFVGFSSDDTESKKTKKKTSNYDMMSDDLNVSDSFLKQTEVLRKILLRYFSDNTEDVEFKIKQEICEILKQFLNYKQDYMLNRLKYQFSYIVTEKLDIIQKLKDSKNEAVQISQILKEFKDAIAENIDAFIPSVLLTGTEIDKNEQFSKQFQSKGLYSQSSNLLNLSNLANFNPLNIVAGNNQKQVKEPKDGEIININKVLGFSVLPSLVPLFCFTQNYQMEDKLLQIMTRFYNQRQEFATLSSKLLILFDQENQKVLDYSKSIITTRLDKNVNESETWMKQLQLKENMDILTQTIKDVQFFADILRMKTKPEVSVEPAVNGDKSEGIRQYFTSLADPSESESQEEQESRSSQVSYGTTFDHITEMDPIRQDIFYHNKVHILAVNLVKDSIYLLEELQQMVGDKRDPSKRNQVAENIYEKMRTLFRTCMTFLKNFAYKNTINQNLLSEYLEKLYKALPFDIGLMELYWEIFRNNKKICLEHQEHISEDFIGLIQKNGRQARYLEFFIIIQKAGDEYLLQNQKLVINSFLNDKLKHNLLYLSSQPDKVEFDFTQVHPNDEPYLYHGKMIQMLAMTTIGKEGMYISEQKLREQITLRYAFELLGLQDTMTKNPVILAEGEAAQVQEIKEEEGDLASGRSDSQPLKFDKSGFNHGLGTKDQLIDRNINISQQSLGQEEEESQEEDLEQVEQLKSHLAGVDNEKVKHLKVPLLNYIYYTFLESEKISDEFNKYLSDFIAYIRFETDRVLTAKEFSDEYYEYFNQFLFTLSAYKKAFASTVQQQQQAVKQDNQKDSENQNIHKEFTNLLQAVLSKKMLFVQQDYYIAAVNAKKTKITKEQYRKYKQWWRIFRSLMEGKRIQAGKMEEDENQKEKLVVAEVPQRLKAVPGVKKDTFAIANLGNNLLNGLNVFGIGKKEEIEIDPDCDLFQNLTKDHVIWQRLWDIFLDQFLNSEYLKVQIDTEHTIFAQALEKVETLFKDNPVVNEIINKNEIFKKLISFLQKAYKEQHEIDTFKLILNCLGNFIQPPKEELADTKEDESKEAAEQESMEANQNFLNQNNATYMLLSLLSDHSNPKINDAVFSDLINFGIRLLEEGNNEVQKSVYSYFMNFTSSEVFFKRIHTKLTDEISRIKRGYEETKKQGFFFEQQNDQIYSILRFLQLFAEGHNLDLQKYMRLQTQNYHNFDLIEVIIELLNTYFKNKSVRYIGNMTQCLDTLTEYIQGPCKENQHALIQDNFLDLASSLLGIDEIMDEINLEIKKEKEKKEQEDSDQEDKGTKRKVEVSDSEEDELLPRWEISKLKYKCSITLISLLEARSKEDDIVPRMMKTLNIDIIRRNITDIYNQYIEIGKKEYNSELFNHFDLDPDDSDKPEHKKKCSFIIEIGFNLFILLNTFKEVSKDEEDTLLKRKKKKETGKEENLLKNNIISELIQLVFKLMDILRRFVQDSANQVGNMMKAKMKEDWNEKKMKVKNNRDLLSDEALKFFEKHTIHIEVLREDDNQLEKTYFYLPYFCQDLDKDTKIIFNRNANRISVKAKVTSLMNSSEDLIKKMKHNYQLHKWLEKIPLLLFIKEKIALFRNLAFLLAIVINIMVLFSFERISDDSGNMISKNQYTEQPIRVLGVVLIVLSVIVVLYFLALNAPLLIMKAWAGPSKHTLLEYLLRLYTTVMNLLSDFYVLYYVIYGMTAVVGTIVSPFFFFFHLFDVLVRSPDLLNVVQAVWIPKKSILFTYFLFLVLMYVFTLFGYYWLKDSYPGDFCESTFVCLITAIDRSFKFDGGIGGFMNSTTQEDTNRYFLIRFFFDNLYYILLMIIMINIVSGIIIDQFGEGRDELREYNEDLLYKCFICGFSNEEIEKNSEQNQDFKSHIKEDHYMWNYLYYIAYLKDKTPTEYTGIESYVADKLDKKEITWFPTNRAMCMGKNMSLKQNQEVFNSLQDIVKSQKKIRNSLENVNSTLDQFQIDYQGELLKNQLKKEEEQQQMIEQQQQVTDVRVI